MNIDRRSFLVATSIVTGMMVSSIRPSLAQSAVYPKPLLLLSEARVIIDGALAYAREQKFDIAIAVVDLWGNTVSADRMDDTSLRHIVQAQGKAYASALYRQTTEKMAELLKSQPDRFFGILTVYGNKMYVVGGGVPLIADGTVLGGVGVSGGPRAGTDEAAAHAGITAWMKVRPTLKR